MTHGATTAAATSAGTAIPAATARHPRSRKAAAATSAHVVPTQAASLRARAATPIAAPRARSRGSRARAGGRRTSRTMRRHATSAGRANAFVESRCAEGRTSGRATAATIPAPTASVRDRSAPSDRSSATSAAIRQAATATSAPRTAATGSVVAYAVEPATSIAPRPRRLGRGSQISNAGRGKKRPKAPLTGSRAGVAYDQIASLTKPRPSARARATPQ